MGEADKGQEKGKYANKPYRLYDFRAALGPNPMEEAALVAEKAKAVRRKATLRPCSARRGSLTRSSCEQEVAAMPEEVAVQRTRARPREGQEDVENRLLFSARCRRGRAQCDGYFAQFLETLRAEVVQEQEGVAAAPEPEPEA